MFLKKWLLILSVGTVLHAQEATDIAPIKKEPFRIGGIGIGGGRIGAQYQMFIKPELLTGYPTYLTFGAGIAGLELGVKTDLLPGSKYFAFNPGLSAVISPFSQGVQVSGDLQACIGGFGLLLGVGGLAGPNAGTYFLPAGSDFLGYLIRLGLVYRGKWW